MKCNIKKSNYTQFKRLLKVDKFQHTNNYFDSMHILGACYQSAHFFSSAPKICMLSKQLLVCWNVYTFNKRLNCV